MRAAIWNGPGSMEIGTAPDPVCPEDGVLLQVLACGVCGTDVRSFYNGDRRIEAPWVLGHEISGEVVEIGPRAEAEVAGGRHRARRRGALHLDAVVRPLPPVPRRRREPLPERRADGLRPPRRLRGPGRDPEHRAQEPVPDPRRAVARARDVRRPAVGRDLRPQGHRDRPRRRRRRDRRRARSAPRTRRWRGCRAPARCCCSSGPPAGSSWPGRSSATSASPTSTPRARTARRP